MNAAFQKLHPNEQRELVLTFAQSSVAKFLQAVIDDAAKQQVTMQVPAVGDASACQQYVSDIVRTQAQTQAVLMLMHLVQNYLPQFTGES